jgi:gentisate 1,2-dioxygenase
MGAQHRHTPNAVRMIVEGEGAYTTVDGEKCPMSRGDLILTPTGLWHEHGHDGSQPVVWLDVLDLPMVYYMEASYAIEGQRQAVKPGRGDRAYTRGGMLPTPVFTRSTKAYPMLRYPWADARAALEAWPPTSPSWKPVQVTYINPETGGRRAQHPGLLRADAAPGPDLSLPARSPAWSSTSSKAVQRSACKSRPSRLAEADTCCAPGYTAVTLRNLSADVPSFVFMADESPLHRKLGVYEVRA